MSRDEGLLEGGPSAILRAVGSLLVALSGGDDRALQRALQATTHRAEPERPPVPEPAPPPDPPADDEIVLVLQDARERAQQILDDSFRKAEELIVSRAPAASGDAAGLIAVVQRSVADLTAELRDIQQRLARIEVLLAGGASPARPRAPMPADSSGPVASAERRAEPPPPRSAEPLPRREPSIGVFAQRAAPGAPPPARPEPGAVAGRDARQADGPPASALPPIRPAAPARPPTPPTPPPAGLPPARAAPPPTPAPPPSPAPAPPSAPPPPAAPAAPTPSPMYPAPPPPRRVAAPVATPAASADEPPLVTFRPQEGALLIRATPVSGFQGLMRIQDSLNRLPMVRQATVEAYAQGEARLRVELAETTDSDEIAAGLRSAMGQAVRVREANEADRSLLVVVG